MSITQKDVDTFKSLGKATTEAVGLSYQATQLSLDYHAQYAKAVQLNTAAQKAVDNWAGFCVGFMKNITSGAQNPWFQAAAAALSKLPSTRKSLEEGRSALFADMAAHTTLNFAPGQNPEAAADAADAQAKASGRQLPKKGSGGRPLDPQIPSLDPTAEEPVTIPAYDSLGTPAKVGIAAAVGLALLWIVRKVA
jgi:hypothetical protein